MENCALNEAHDWETEKRIGSWQRFLPGPEATILETKESTETWERRKKEWSCPNQDTSSETVCVP